MCAMNAAAVASRSRKAQPGLCRAKARGATFKSSRSEPPRVSRRLPETVNRVERHLSHRKQTLEHPSTRDVAAQTFSRISASKALDAERPKLCLMLPTLCRNAAQSKLTCCARQCYQSKFTFTRGSDCADVGRGGNRPVSGGVLRFAQHDNGGGMSSGIPR